MTPLSIVSRTRPFRALVYQSAARSASTQPLRNGIDVAPRCIGVNHGQDAHGTPFSHVTPCCHSEHSEESLCSR